MDGLPTSISAQDLYRSIGSHRVAPVVIDVRRSAAFAKLTTR